MSKHADWVPTYTPDNSRLGWAARDPWGRFTQACGNCFVYEGPKYPWTIEGGVFTCKGCKRTYCYCYGCDDPLFPYCDGCWGNITYKTKYPPHKDLNRRIRRHLEAHANTTYH